jgi:hypothetical protein
MVRTRSGVVGRSRSYERQLLRRDGPDPAAIEPNLKSPAPSASSNDASTTGLHPRPPEPATPTGEPDSVADIQAERLLEPGTDHETILQRRPCERSQLVQPPELGRRALFVEGVECYTGGCGQDASRVVPAPSWKGLP